MRISRKLVPALLVAGPLCLLCSCSEPPPPSRDEIFRQRLELPALYLTVQTGKRVTAPMSRGIFVDPESGEVCWPALACNAPDCPGRGPQGEPYLFIEPDAAFYAKPDRTLGYDKDKVSGKGKSQGPCPECLKKRNPAAETEQQRQQYVSNVQVYVLPETAVRLKQLDEELKRRNVLDRQQRVGKALPEKDGNLKPIPQSHP